MKLTSMFVAVIVLPIGCATPPEVKQALIEKDAAYAENARLMDIHRELLESLDRRYWYWYRYARKLSALDNALKWATTDPEAPETAVQALTKTGMPLDKAQEQARLNHVSMVKLVMADQPALLRVINTMRLKDLPERKGKDGLIVFERGHADMTRLVQGIPDLIEAINQGVEAKFQEDSKAADYSAFDDYQTNLAALRRINGVVKRYLDIDVTVTGTEIRELADQAKKLR
jgi:hypothetical protein